MATEKNVELAKDEKNPIVLLKLDRPREVNFGHSSLKKLTALTGKKLTSLDESDFDLADLEKVMWCGLLADAKEHGEDLKLSDMEELLDKAESFGDITDAMTRAMEKAFQPTEKLKN